MARNEEEGGQERYEGLWTRKSGKCLEHYPVPVCGARLSEMHENMCSSGSLTRKQWLSQTPAISSMEEPASLCSFQ